MHPSFERASALAEFIIGSSIEVHRNKGPGLIESIYEWFLMMEAQLRRIDFVTQKLVEIHYKGFTRKEPIRFDILVGECVLDEVQAVQQVLPIHKAQLLSYMKLLDVPLGLLVNFHDLKLVDGIHQLMLPGANQ